jgi:putative transposase
MFHRNIWWVEKNHKNFSFRRNDWCLLIKLHVDYINMPNTYTQIHIQFVFAVKFRGALISNDWKERLHQYITAIFQDNNHRMLQINSMPDHIHIFIGMRPNQSISSLIQNVKTESSKWIKTQKLCSHNFAWQEGYGAFSYAKSQVTNVIRYIQNREDHNEKESFLDEYRKFLKLFEVEWDEQYIFKELE